MNAYADGVTPAWDVESGSGELLFEQADRATEWVAEAGWDAEATWDADAGEATLEGRSFVWPDHALEHALTDGEAIPLAAIVPALAQLAPVLLQAAPAIIGAVQTAMPALQQLLQGFTQGGAPAAVTRGREMAAETAVLESTLAAMENLLADAEAAGIAIPANALVEPPESRFAAFEGGEFLPALAGIVAALAPVVGQVISTATSKKRARPASRPPARPQAPPQPVAAPMPAVPPAGAGAMAGTGAQALALLPQLMPLLAQLATQLAAPPGGEPGAMPPAVDPGLGMPAVA